MWNFGKFVKTFAVRVILGASLALVTVAPVLAVDPISLSEVGATVGTSIAAEKGMLFGIMAAILGIAVLLLIFRKGKATVR